MKKLQDKIGTVIFWGGILSLLGIVVTAAVIKGMARETVEKVQGAVRQPVRPTCTKRSCKFPWDVPKLSGEGSEQDSKSEK